MRKGRSYLPDEGTPEWEEEKKFFETADIDALKKRAKKLGYSSLDGYIKGMRFREVARLKEPSPLITEPVTELSDLESSILSIVKKNVVSVGEISRQVDRSSETVIKTIDSLISKHYDVVLDETRHEVSIPHEPSKTFEPTEFKYYRNFFTIGIVTDTHLCSTYQQATLLHDAYKIFDDRQTDFNIHAGDLVDGIDMYRGHRQELFKFDASTQRQYAIDNYPKSSRNTKTYIIGGQHDFSFFKQNGYDIVEHICEKRDDLIYRGFFNTQFSVKGLLVDLQHPGGGLAYALSYNPQKLAESVSGYVLSTMRSNPANYKNLPVLMLIGHYHVPMHLPNYMGMDISTLPCFQTQTRYLQQKKKMPTVGCAIAELWLDKDNNLSSVTIEFIVMNHRVIEKDY
jgi:hypothetical protein